jgi:AraC-like DNA-binding protein
MKAYLKFDIPALTNQLLTDLLQPRDIKFRIVAFGEIEFSEKLSPKTLEEITSILTQYGIEIIESQKTILIQKIKDVIVDMVYDKNTTINVKSSVYLAEKFGHSYGYLSNLFSEVTYTSIENFIIMQKIEFTKQLIINNQLSLTEIAFQLNYSSVAHLSTQFKNTTGITPSAFQRIIKKRRELTTQNTY